MSELEWITVAPADWVATAHEFREQGFSYLDLLSARELESGAFVLTAHLVDVGAAASQPERRHDPQPEPPERPSSGAELIASGQPRSLRNVMLESEWPAELTEELASLVPVFPGARWHELEASELFGISFGHDREASEPLLSSQPALRRDFALQPRLETPWPGTNEPGLAPDHPRRKRKRAVPGNPVNWEAGE